MFKIKGNDILATDFHDKNKSPVGNLWNICPT